MDLSTKYMGITLDGPFIVGASPMSDTLDSARALEDAGASALVMRSLLRSRSATTSRRCICIPARMR